MTIAIMQPYIFPYIGYFQLIAAVDKFVIYDDVNFIKQGWINRNNILVQNKASLFSIPLKSQSSFTKINEAAINTNLYTAWKAKFLKTLDLSYRKAPYFKEVYALVEGVLSNDDPEATIAALARKSIQATADYLEIKTEIVTTSAVYNNQSLSGKTRVIDICEKENAQHYINPVGGQELYDKVFFADQGIVLNFIKTLPIIYKQFSDEHFVPWLSVIDVMMFNSKEEIAILLGKYELI